MPHEEYLRRNVVMAKACGLDAEIDLTAKRLGQLRRAPKWLTVSLAAMRDRSSALPIELARWRDASPDKP